jgi:hypothetical protein
MILVFDLFSPLFSSERHSRRGSKVLKQRHGIMRGLAASTGVMTIRRRELSDIT